MGLIQNDIYKPNQVDRLRDPVLPKHVMQQNKIKIEIKTIVAKKEVWENKQTNMIIQKWFFSLK